MVYSHCMNNPLNIKHPTEEAGAFVAMLRKTHCQPTAIYTHVHVTPNDDLMLWILFQPVQVSFDIYGKNATVAEVTTCWHPKQKNFLRSRSLNQDSFSGQFVPVHDDF